MRPSLFESGVYYSRGGGFIHASDPGGGERQTQNEADFQAREDEYKSVEGEKDPTCTINIWGIFWDPSEV